MNISLAQTPAGQYGIPGLLYLADVKTVDQVIDWPDVRKEIKVRKLLPLGTEPADLPTRYFPGPTTTDDQGKTTYIDQWLFRGIPA